MLSLLPPDDCSPLLDVIAAAITIYHHYAHHMLLTIFAMRYVDATDAPLLFITDLPIYLFIFFRHHLISPRRLLLTLSILFSITSLIFFIVSIYRAFASFLFAAFCCCRCRTSPTTSPLLPLLMLIDVTSYACRYSSLAFRQIIAGFLHLTSRTPLFPRHHVAFLAISGLSPCRAFIADAARFTLDTDIFLARLSTTYLAAFASLVAPSCASHHAAAFSLNSHLRQHDDAAFHHFVRLPSVSA